MKCRTWVDRFTWNMAQLVEIKRRKYGPENSWNNDYQSQISLVLGEYSSHVDWDLIINKDYCVFFNYKDNLLF